MASSSGHQGRKRRFGIRWWIVILAFLASSINYLDRANMGVAIPYMQKDLNLSPEVTGLVLGAFFWTYAIFQLPGGWLADRFGARVMYSVAVIWWSFATALTALARGFVSLFAFRLLLGAGEAPTYPTCAKVVSEWFPRQERAFASSIFDNGARVGTALSLPVVTGIIATLGWRAAFPITGALGLVWVVFWIWFYRRPRRHWKVSEEEIQYIEAGGARTTEEEEVSAGKQRSGDVRWRDLFRYARSGG